MKKRIFSVLVSIILILSIICCASVPGSAIFVVDDVLLYSIGISVAASIALSCGIAVASGQDNAFSTGANALGQIVYESLQEQYSQAQLLSMIVISNGKVYFKSPESLYTRIKNFLSNYDFSGLTSSHTVTTDSNYFIPTTTSISLASIPGKYSLGEVGQPLSLTTPSWELNFVPNLSLSLVLSDGTLLKTSNIEIPDGCLSYGITYPNNASQFSVYCCLDSSNHYSSVSNCTHLKGVISFLRFENWNNCQCYSPSGTLLQIDSPSDNWIRCNGEIIYKGMSFSNYKKACISNGTILVNQNVSVLPRNVDSNGNISVPVDIEKYPSSIPDSEIGRDSSILIPLPGNIVDPSNPDIPLTQSSVKNRIKRGQTVEFVPQIEKLNGILPRDYPVLITNTVTDTQVIDTPLSTTYIGDNSETFLVIPNNPGSVVIPGADDEPIVNYPYPDVINPGNETITIVNNPDVFPTRVPAESATAAPGETVGEITRVSEIVSEAVSDIVQPVTPEDIERGANKMRLSEMLIRKFPFCIPFDFYNAINQFSAPAEVPVFDIPFTLQRLNIDYNFHIDLTQFETAAKISRWFFSVSWVVVLIFLTRKVIWK